MTETHLRSGDIFRLANYVCHRNDRLTEGVGTAILSVAVWITVPVQGLEYLDAIDIQIMLAIKPVKILAVYLSPSRPLLASDLSTCFGGGLPVLMAGDLNFKNVEWNSRLTRKKQTLE